MHLGQSLLGTEIIKIWFKQSITKSRDLSSSLPNSESNCNDFTPFLDMLVLSCFPAVDLAGYFLRNQTLYKCCWLCVILEYGCMEVEILMHGVMSMCMQMLYNV